MSLKYYYKNFIYMKREKFRRGFDKNKILGSGKKRPTYFELMESWEKDLEFGTLKSGFKPVWGQRWIYKRATKQNFKDF